MAIQYVFYSRPDYYKELECRISETVAGHRIAIASMTLQLSSPSVKNIIDQLTEAASRGVKVDFLIDAYSFLVAGNSMRPGPLLFRKQLHQRMPPLFRDQLEVLEKLKMAGGRYTITNRPSRPLTRPFAGRSHLKFAIINDRLFLGGCNLDAPDRLDMMVSWDDKQTADWLYGLAYKIISSGKTRQAMKDKDFAHKLDPKSELLIDCGKPKQSLIFKKALELIDEAQKSVFVACQFLPNSVTLEHLRAAHRRGVKVTIVYNYPSKHGVLKGGLHQIVTLRERARTPAELFKNYLPKDGPFLHAKLIATEQGAIIGSHNYVVAGVNFGTAEIALLKHDPVFARQALEALKKQYGPVLKEAEMPQPKKRPAVAPVVDNIQL